MDAIRTQQRHSTVLSNKTAEPINMSNFMGYLHLVYSRSGHSLYYST